MHLKNYHISKRGTDQRYLEEIRKITEENLMRTYERKFEKETRCPEEIIRKFESKGWIYRTFICSDEILLEVIAAKSFLGESTKEQKPISH
ncbi:hypothetical protein J4481_01505 [Candidatus Pacearchaeota archaeon]|nr:hypothetical protein [Candidatus Pacearchaeota archaeon]